MIIKPKNSSTALDHNRNREVFQRAVHRFGAVPKSSIRQSVKKRAKRGRKCWAIDFAHPFPNLCRTADNRVRRFPKDQTRAGAEAKAEELWRECYIEAELALAECEPKIAEFITQTFWPRYPKKGKRGVLSPQTIRTYRNHLVLYILPRLGQYRFSEVTSLILEDFLGDMLSDDGLSPKYVNNIRGVVSLVFRKAHEWQETKHLIAVPSVVVPKRLPEYLTFGDKRRLLAAALDDFEYALFKFAMDTGARPGEVIAARRSDIKRDRAQVSIPRSYSDYTEWAIPDLRDGARNLPKRPGFKLPKDDEERFVPLSPGLDEALARIGDTDGLLFPVSLESLPDRLHAAMERAGIRKLPDGTPRTFRFYDLRHTFASHLALRGLPLQRIQKWMGHSSVTVTERYIHLRPTDDSEALALAHECDDAVRNILDDEQDT